MSHGIGAKYVSRFFTKLSKPDENGCIHFLGYITNRGYGQYNLSGRKDKIRDYSHRVAWRIANDSEIPEGMMICHKCDITTCCNPDHLFLGTPKDNSQDMVAKGRQVSGVKSKLSRQEIFEIQHLSSLGLKGSVISSTYNISESRVSQIVNNKFIKQVKDEL